MESITSPFQTFRDTRFFGGLDGLRAVSILAVIWHHGRQGHNLDIPLLDSGYHGVKLFFVISGFLITTLLLRERDQNGRISLSKFYMRRTLRIFPLYYGALVAYYVLILLVKPDTPESQVFFGNIFHHLTYTSNWANRSEPFGFAWSLASEEQFYLAWPLLLLLFPRLRSLLFLSVFLGVQVFLRLRLGLEINATDSFLVRFVDLVPPAILLGIGVAFMLHHGASFALAWRLFGWKGADIIAWIAAIAVLSNAEWSSVPYLIQVTLALVVATTVIRPSRILSPLFEWRPVAWIGTVSYGMYLMHVLSLGMIHRVARDILPPSSLGRFLVASAITVAAASLSYLTYERFFLKLKERYKAT